MEPDGRFSHRKRPALPKPPRPGRSLYDRPYALLSLTSLSWAINIVLGRFIAGTVPPVALAEIRWAGAGIILLPFAAPRLRHDWPTIRAHLPIMLTLSLTGITIYNTLAYTGLQYTEAINGSLMQSSAPLMIGLWSLVLFRDRLTAAQFFGILTSLAGVLVIIAHGDLTALVGLTLNKGDVLFLTAMFSYAFYAALLRRRPPIHFLSFLTFTILAGAIMLAPLTAIEFAAGRRVAFTPAGTRRPRLRRHLPVDHRVPVLQPRGRTDRRQPRRTVLPSDPGVRLGHRRRLPRRAAAGLSRRRLRPHHRRHRHRPARSPSPDRLKLVRS